MTKVIDLATGLRPRHPEKAWRKAHPIQRKPAWIRAKAPTGAVFHEVRALAREANLVTVCEEAACPNMGECWSRRHATVMIMGAICTRACAFCNVATGKPLGLDAQEPARVGDFAAKLRLKHVVITSVDRDDLADGGAAHFAQTVYEVRKRAPQASIEILTPDFRAKGHAALEVLAQASPDVFNHNLETTPRLYPSIRPGARYYTSLRLLERARELNPTMITKSGLMVGLGEDLAEVHQVMDDMREAGVMFLTIGQYLQPTPRHAPVARFVPPEEFDALAARARARGFAMVSASPMTRSSHNADADFAQLRAALA